MFFIVYWSYVTNNFWWLSSINLSSRNAFFYYHAFVWVCVCHFPERKLLKIFSICNVNKHHVTDQHTINLKLHHEILGNCVENKWRYVYVSQYVNLAIYRSLSGIIIIVSGLWTGSTKENMKFENREFLRTLSKLEPQSEELTSRQNWEMLTHQL